MALTYDEFEAVVFDHLHGYFAGAAPLDHEGGTIASPEVLSANAGFTPADVPFVELDILGSGRNQIGPSDRHVLEARGRLQATAYVPTGWGTALLAKIGDRVEAAWAALSEPGVKTYATQLPRPAPSPPAGFVGRVVDTPFLWLSAPADEAYVSTAGIEYTQAAHGFSVGQAVVDQAGVWVPAQANGTDPADTSDLASGIVTLVRDTNRFRVVAEPAVLSISHSFNVGDLLWLSRATAGLITSTDPGGDGWRQQLGRILPGSLLLWEPVIPEFA